VSTNGSVRETLIRIFRDQFEHPGLDETVTTATCAAWDSLGHIKLLVAIEQEFHFEPSPEEIVAMYTDFHAVERIVSGKIAAR